MAAPLPDRLLRVDLSSGTISSDRIPDERLHAFIGGKGLGARYLYESVGPDVGPLSPENVLLLLVGPLTGYLPGDGRFTAITKSPLTGLFLDSYAGGSFGPSFRAAMPDHAGILLDGRAEGTRVLDLAGDEPRLADAPELAGASIDSVDAAFPDDSVVSIGPAGEAGVAFATIAADGGDHQAGRGGAGAVMGSKGLKGIVVEATRELPPPNEAIGALRETTTERFAETPYGGSYLAGGTLETVDFADALSILPTRGWRAREFDGASGIGIAAAQSAAEREHPERPLPGDFRASAGETETVIRGGTPIALGATLGLDDFGDVKTLAGICDRLGIDVISAGNAVALAMLASERGRIDRTVSFGDVEGAQALLEEMGTRSTRLGSLLADGVDAAAEALGMRGEIPTVKHMAVPSFDPRGAPAMALAYATSDRGACHRRAVPATVEAFDRGWTPTQTARAMIAEQDRRATLWCLVVDDVLTPMFDDLGASWLSALGVSITPEELEGVGRRTWTLTRLFNVREGVDRDADGLPAVFQRADAGGAEGLDRETFERTLDRYYEMREWDGRGRPSRRLVERLGLADVVDDRTPIGGHPLHSVDDESVTRTDGGE